MVARYRCEVAVASFQGIICYFPYLDRLRIRGTFSCGADRQSAYHGSVNRGALRCYG